MKSIIVATILCILIIPSALIAQDHSAHTSTQVTRSESSRVNSDFFSVMKEVMTGRWEGEYTNGTFEEPTEWSPIAVEYRTTANDTAIIENYIDPAEQKTSMTTVYYKDRNDLRLTHYCGAANHPSMLATSLNDSERSVSFDFTGISNLIDSNDYHSRQMEVTIESNNKIKIQYHGVMDGGIIASQAYSLSRSSTATDDSTD